MNINKEYRRILAFQIIILILFISTAMMLPTESSSTVYSQNWGGYSVYYGSPPSNRLAFVSGNLKVIDISQPNYWDGTSHIALAPWIGMSLYSNGNPYLLQAGYNAEYFPSNGSRRYFIWVELYPYPPGILGIIDTTLVNEIDYIAVSLLKYPGQSNAYVSISIYFINGTKRDLGVVIVNGVQTEFAYAHFIVETPTIDNIIATLPSFHENITIFSNVVGYAYTNDLELTSYNVNTLIAGGNYIREILAQCVIDPDNIINNLYIYYTIFTGTMRILHMRPVTGVNEHYLFLFNNI